MTFDFTDLLDADHVRMHLLKGREHGLTKKAIASLTGLHPRDVEEAIRQLRLSGVLVASGNEGYWIGTPSEIEATLESLRGRMRTQYQTYRALKAALRRHRTIVEGQITLFGDVVVAA